jgi:hypothetical protein
LVTIVAPERHRTRRVTLISLDTRGSALTLSKNKISILDPCFPADLLEHANFLRVGSECRHGRSCNRARSGCFTLVRAAGLEPAQRFLTEGFSYQLRLSPPRRCSAAPRRVCGLDYTFTMARSRLRCCPSSLYTFAPAVQPVRLARDCLLPVSPSLGSSAPSVSRRALKLLKSLASTNSATPALSGNLIARTLVANSKAQACAFAEIYWVFASTAAFWPVLAASGCAPGSAQVNVRRRHMFLLCEAIEVLDHLHAGAAVLRDLIDVGASHKAHGDVRAA